MPFVPFLLLLCLLIYLIYKNTTSTYGYWKARNVQFAPPKFPFGNAADVIFRKETMATLLRKLYESSTEKLLGFWILNSPQLLIRDPELVKNVLVKDAHHFAALIITLQNHDWKVLRNNVSPIFTTSKLKSMSKTIIQTAEQLKHYLHSVHDKGPVEAKEFCMRFSVNAVVACVFGLDAHCFEQENAAFVVAGKRLLGPSFLNSVRFYVGMVLPSVVKWSGLGLFDKPAMQFLQDAFVHCIDEREKSRVSRNDFIDILVKMKQSMETSNGIDYDKDRLIPLAIFIYGAGFDTTSTTLTFALFELSHFPSFQERTRLEIKAVLDEYGSLTLEALQKLDHLEWFVDETLRKHPAVPVLGRVCIRDYKVPDSNIVIEKGTSVYIPTMGLHNDEKYFHNPQEFHPERHSEENTAKRPTHSFLPFGHGPHNCIGERFGLMAVKICLAHILMDFKVEVCPETPDPLKYNSAAVLLHPAGDLKLQFTKL